MAIALVQHKASVPGTGSSTSVTFSSPTGAGNLLTVCSEANTSVSITSVSNTAGATWAKAVSLGSDSGQVVEIWYAANNSGNASDAITVNFSVSDYHSFYVAEWSGAAISSVLDATASAKGTSGSAATGSFSATNGDLVLGVFIFSSGSASVGSGFTQLDTDTFSLSEYLILSGSSTNVLGSGGSSNWAVLGATFKPLASTGLFGRSDLGGLSTSGPKQFTRLA